MPPQDSPKIKLWGLWINPGLILDITAISHISKYIFTGDINELEVPSLPPKIRNTPQDSSNTSLDPVSNQGVREGYLIIIIWGWDCFIFGYK
jgi:hypothetical protein